MVTYADSDRFLNVCWEGYKDDESGIKAFYLQLQRAPSCTNDMPENREVLVDWIERFHNDTCYRFSDMELEVRNKAKWSYFENE